MCSCERADVAGLREGERAGLASSSARYCCASIVLYLPGMPARSTAACCSARGSTRPSVRAARAFPPRSMRGSHVGSDHGSKSTDLTKLTHCRTVGQHTVYLVSTVVREGRRMESDTVPTGHSGGSMCTRCPLLEAGGGQAPNFMGRAVGSAVDTPCSWRGVRPRSAGTWACSSRP